MKDIIITKSEDEQHLYVYNKKLDIAKSYQLLKLIPNCHYLYVFSHGFTHPYKGMFGNELPVKDKVEDLGHNVLYIYKPKQRRSNGKQDNQKTNDTL